MIFEIHAEKGTNDRRVFYYDNQDNILKTDSGEIIEWPQRPDYSQLMTETRAFDKNSPLKKSNNIRILKIQLGLSCNYTCDYCSQKFVERPPETSKKDIDNFLRKLDVLNFGDTEPLKIEFWGGEPLVYWKTLKPLAEALADRWANRKEKPHFSLITNGSLLSREICSWLYYMGFSVGISHDGPGQAVRGPDPFDDPEKKKIILEFYNIMRPQGRISFNVMLNRRNTSRQEINDWFVNLTGDPMVPIGEGGIVDAYDADGQMNSLNTLQEHFEYRQKTFGEMLANGRQINFGVIKNKIDDFTKSVLTHRSSKYLGQKCGMDDESVIAVDLKGNIVTCQNVSVMETSKNGESHLGGNLENYNKVELKSVTHWKNRKNCHNCPVLQLCKGSCMYLEGEFWDHTCDNAYSENVALFALGFELMTGYIPVLIKADELPLDRQDIWGTVYQHTEKTKRKIIPLKIVTEKIGKIDDVEIYGKSRIE